MGVQAAGLCFVAESIFIQIPNHMCQASHADSQIFWSADSFSLMFKKTTQEFRGRIDTRFITFYFAFFRWRTQMSNEAGFTVYLPAEFQVVGKNQVTE